MKRIPLRITLVAVVLGLTGLGLTLSGLAATRSLHGYLQDRLDTQLVNALATPRDLAAACGAGPRRPSSFGTIYVQFAGSACPLPAGVVGPRFPDAIPTDQRPFTVAGQVGDQQWRAVGSLTTGGELLVIAVPLDEVDRTVARLTLIELVVGLVVLSALGLGAFGVVRRSLRPLVAVERAAGLVAAGDLTQRVPETDPRTEVGSLSRSFNAMVAQVEAAFGERESSEAEARESEEKMRRFVGDASHELRTPLTSIRGFAELYRQGALPAPADVDRAMSRVEAEASRMGLLVEDLLLLARLDQQRPLDRTAVDLFELASDAVQDALAVEPGRQISVEIAGDGPPPVVSGDEARLRQVLGNLVSNALTHSTSAVTVRVSTQSSLATVEVIDAGPGIAPHDRAKVFERFFRADSSRTRASGGSGLGLSIVAALVTAHDGTVTVDDTPGGGATFRVTLPLAP